MSEKNIEQMKSAMEDILRRVRSVVPEAQREKFRASSKYQRYTLDQVFIPGDESGNQDREIFSAFFWDQELNHLEIRSTDPLCAYVFIPRMMAALEGLPVYVSCRESWHWDHDYLRPTGRPTHERVYVLSITHAKPMSSQVFSMTNPQAQEDLEMMDRICLADTPVNGLCLFDYQREMGHEGLFHAYTWTNEGLIAESENKVNASLIGKKIFPECAVKVSKDKDTGSWCTAVKFPKQMDPATVNA